MKKQIDPKILELCALPAIGQVGIVVKNMEKAFGFYRDFLRWGPFEVFQFDYTDRTYRGKPGNFKMRIALAQVGPTQVELIEPLEGESIYKEFLEKGVEGFHHLGFHIDRIEERIAAMKQLGFEVVQSGKRPGSTWAYMDTQSFSGPIIELIDRKKG